jgi:hypothetical protein
VATLLLGVTALLGGCAHHADLSARDASVIPTARAAPDRHGILFLTLGTQQPQPLDLAHLEVRPVGQGGRTLESDFLNRGKGYRDRAVFDYRAEFLHQPASDFSDSTEAGRLYVAVLPAGDYEIYSYHFRWGRWGSQNRLTEPFFSAPFRLRAGEALYLGRFIARVTHEPVQTALGTFRPDVSLFFVRSMLDEDTALLAREVAPDRGFKIIDGGLPACAIAAYTRCEARP